jgi:SAM-dependent methyltransferase
MAEDKHLGTGEYDPEKYWSARVKASKGACYAAVCVFDALKEENESAHKVQISAILKTLKGIDLRGKDVLEFGCGAGRLIPLFKQSGSVWHGIDISNDMLSMAKDRYGDVDLKKVINGRIPYPDSSMDFVYSVTVIHHNPYGAQEEIASEMTRVLKDEGYLLILEDLGEKNQFNMYPRDRKSWIRLFEKHGLTIYRQSGVRYWLLRDSTLILKGMAYKLFKRLLPRKKKFDDKQESPDRQSSNPGYFRKLIGRLDLIIDPYVYPLVPRRFHSAAVMLFKKGAVRNNVRIDRTP